MKQENYFLSQKSYLKIAVTLNTKIKLLIVILLTQFSNITYAQNTYQIGLLPSLNINSKLKNNWSINAKVESRQLFERGDFKDKVEKKYKYVLTDYSLIVAKKIIIGLCFKCLISISLKN
jgi:hypothetical protein